MSIHTICPTTVRLTTADLGTGYRLILWAVRRWVRCIRTGQNAVHEIRHGFAGFGIPGSATILDKLMLCVGTGAVRPIEIRSDGALGISTDEYRILRMIQAASDGQLSLAVALVSDAMTGPAAEQIADLGSDLATTLVSGLGDFDRLPVPRSAAPQMPTANMPAAKVVTLVDFKKTTAA